MSKLKIFWKNNCSNCPSAKQIGEKCIEQGKIVEYYNVETPDGLAEGSFYDVLSTPTLVVTDEQDNLTFLWCGKIPVLAEVLEKL